jgi:hypothetical protein
MTTIPASFAKYGYVFSLIKRSAKAAIYGQYRGDKLHAYEVHRLRVRKAHVSGGIEYPASERLASEQEWGVWGKTYSASLYGRGEARALADAGFERASEKREI